MKKATTILAAVLAIAALAIVAVSCDGTTPDPDDNGLGDGRKISRLTVVGNPNALDEYDRRDRVYDFEYDAQNRLVSLTGPLFSSGSYSVVNDEIRFAYAGDRVTVTGFPQSEISTPLQCDEEGHCEEGDTYIATQTLEAQLNGSGYLASATATVVWDHDLPDDVITLTATYDANGYLTGLAFHVDHPGKVEDYRYTVAWTAGNLTRLQVSTDEYSSAQYSTSLHRANIDLNWIICSNDAFFDLDEFQLFAYAGLLGRHNLNLVAQTVDNRDGGPAARHTYSYVFDPDGYVTQWTVDRPDSPDYTPDVVRVEYRQ
ncbi:MAG: DUF4595 domain-containing protein [Prevotellaceae bacterium]|jgi:hypothetical protein|nr:DUF4595 domain-containing protein [Prevotellaceae bacterium]